MKWEELNKKLFMRKPENVIDKIISLIIEYSKNKLHLLDIDTNRVIITDHYPFKPIKIISKSDNEIVAQILFNYVYDPRFILYARIKLDIEQRQTYFKDKYQQIVKNIKIHLFNPVLDINYYIESNTPNRLPNLSKVVKSIVSTMDKAFRGDQFNYIVFDIGSKDIISFGKYSKDKGKFEFIKVFTSFIVDRASKNIRKSLYNNITTYIDAFIDNYDPDNLTRSNIISFIKDRIKQDNQLDYIAIEKSVNKFVNKILPEHITDDIVILLPNPQFMVSTELTNILYFRRIVKSKSNEQNNNGDSLRNKLIGNLSKVVVRDIVYDLLFNHIKNKQYKYSAYPEITVKRKFYNMLFKIHNDIKILKDIRTVVILDSDNRFINAYNRQIFDVIVNGFNERILENIKFGEICEDEIISNL